MLIFISLAVITSFLGIFKNETIDYVKKPKNGSEEVSLYFVGENEKEENEISVRLNQKKLNEAEKEKVLNEFAVNLDEKILGKNKSLDEIYYNLNLKEYYPEKNIRVDWISSKPELLMNDGSINNSTLDKKEEIKLEALIYLDDKHIKKEIKCFLFPQNLSKQEKIEKEIKRYIKEQEENNEENIHLPESVDGVRLKFYKERQKVYPITFILIGFIICFLIYFLKRYKDRENDKKNKEILKEEYSLFVTKFYLLYSVGLSIYKSFEKMIVDYKRQKSKKLSFNLLEDAINSIKNGTSEEVAINEFANKTGLVEYKRFASYISEARKKGAKDLKHLLKKEVEESYLTKKSIVLENAQKANTKLLFPMLILLLVVLVIIMFPAMFSFSFI